jgi:hydroxymethylpyrimidine/phosphomethylpyrimidine kinase
MKTALTIAGSDPTGGAGAQADLKTFHSLGVYGLSVISALTAQNTEKIEGIYPVSGKFIEKQLTMLINDIRPDALKTGMLYLSEAITATANIIRGFDLENLVIDPVIISSSGSLLIEKNALAVLKKHLIPLAKVITPNLHEAAALAGIAIKNISDVEKASVAIKKAGVDFVVITGGHLDELSDQKHKETIDLIYDGEVFHKIKGKKIRGQFHGTGCVYSAALTAFLAKGMTVPKAANKAKAFVEEAIKKALSLGQGMGILNV